MIRKSSAAPAQQGRSQEPLVLVPSGLHSTHKQSTASPAAAEQHLIVLNPEPRTQPSSRLRHVKQQQR
jgi:hypothetical protein